jgi:hypothetical protein
MNPGRGKGKHTVNRTIVYLLLFLVVAGSCLIEYCGARLFGSASASRQNRIAVAAIGICTLAAAVFPNDIVVTNLFVLAAALVAGTLLSRRIGSAGALLTMLLVAAIVDVISAHVGPSRWLVDRAQQAQGATVLRFLAISFQLKQRLVPAIGVGDLMFFTAVVSVMRRLGWSETRALAVPLGGILSALGVGLVTGFTPALPFLAGSVWFYARGSNSLRRESCRA